MIASNSQEKYNVHKNCTLLQGSESCIPKLPPNSNQWLKCFRKFKYFCMVSQKNERTKTYFYR